MKQANQKLRGKRAETTLGMFSKEGTFTLKLKGKRKETYGGLDQSELVGNQNKMS